MKRTITLIMVLLWTAGAGAVDHGIVNNSGSDGADSISIPFFALDSSGNVVAMASGDSVFLNVYYPGGQLAYRDSVAFNGTPITAQTVSDYTEYTWKTAVSTIDGTPTDGCYGYILVVNDQTSAALATPHKGTFWLYTTADLEDTYDENAWALDSLQSQDGWVAQEATVQIIDDSIDVYDNAGRFQADIQEALDSLQAQDGWVAQQTEVANLDGASPPTNWGSMAITAGGLVNVASTDTINILSTDTVNVVSTDTVNVLSTDTVQVVSTDSIGTVTGNVDGSVASVTADVGITATAVDDIWDEDSTGHWTSPKMAWVAGQTAAGGLDSTIISNLLHRIVWGTPVGSGSDSSTVAQRDIGAILASVIAGLVDDIWDEDSTGHWTSPNMAFISGQTSASALDSTILSNILHRIVWGTAVGSGSDSSTAAQRDIGIIAQAVINSIWDEDSTGHWTSPNMAFIAGQTSASSLDSAIISNLLHRIVWGTPVGSGSDSSISSQRDIGTVNSGGISSGSFAGDAINSNVIAAGAIGASEIGTGAFDADALAADAVDEFWEYPRANITVDGSIGEYIKDSLALNLDIATGTLSDTQIDDITVGSVTGAVGSVTGNVGGNVSGSVASVASGGISSSSFAVDAITGSAIAAGAIGASEIGTAAIDADAMAPSATGEIADTTRELILNTLLSPGYPTAGDTVSALLLRVNDTWGEVQNIDGWTPIRAGDTLVTKPDLNQAIGNLAASQFEDSAFTGAKFATSYYDTVTQIVIDNATGGTGLDSATTSRIIGRKVWGIAAGSGSDSSQAGQRHIDSAAVARAAWDNDIVSNANRRIGWADTADVVNNTPTSGSGANQCTLYVYNTAASITVPEALVWVENASGTDLAVGTANSDGYVVLNVDNGTIYAYMQLVGYIQTTNPETLTITAPTTDTIEVTAYDPGSPTAGGTGRLYGWTYNSNGTARSGVIVDAQITADFGTITYGSVTITPFEVMDTTDANGYWALDLYKYNAVSDTTLWYQITARQEPSGEVPGGEVFKIKYTMPDSTQHLMKFSGAYYEGNVD